MKLKDIQLSYLSTYRGELMGLAMIFIIFFHVGVPRASSFYGLCRMGNVGVDMFFFLSGIGLWYSWMKSVGKASFPNNWMKFYIRRLWRVYPAWLIVALAFYVPDYLGERNFSKNVTDLIGDVAINWDFWMNDELTFWYIPATMMLYLFAPPYMELIRRHPSYRWLPVAMVAWCTVVQWVAPVHQAVGHIEIFWSRVPIFFIGINMAEAVRRKSTMEGAAIGLLLIMFILPLASSMWLEQYRHGKFPLYTERMLYIPLTVSALLLFTMALRHAPQWLNRSLRFVGTISLEIYLLHVHFILRHFQGPGWNFWTRALACIAIVLPAAWVLHKIIEYVVNKLNPSR